jgi:micrococcal nuclease
VRAIALVAIFGLLALAGCPRRSAEADAGPPCEYGPVTGNCFSGAISLDDTRVESLDESLLPAGASPCRAPVLVRITNVRDGDTFDVSGVSDATVMGGVRLIGVNAPEIEHPPEPRECFGPEAYGFSLQLQGRLAWLTFDAGCTDSFGRLLAYLYVGSGEGDLWQRQLLRRGFARTLTIPPNDELASTFASDEALATSEMRGLYAACVAP